MRVTLSLLLFLCLTVTAQASQRCVTGPYCWNVFLWNAIDNATGYTLKVGYRGDTFQTVADTAIVHPVWGHPGCVPWLNNYVEPEVLMIYCVLDVEVPSGAVLYVIATSYNELESTTEHGDYAGEGWFPWAS